MRSIWQETRDANKLQPRVKLASLLLKPQLMAAAAAGTVCLIYGSGTAGVRDPAN